MILQNESVGTPLRAAVAWGTIQLAVLAIGASGFPLWAHHPFPRESIAFQEMLCTQVIFASLLGPALMGSRLNFLIAVLLMLPMDMLAGLLSDIPLGSELAAWSCVSLWMTGLAMWNWFFIGTHRCLFISMGATVFVLGGVIIDYIRWEVELTLGQNGVGIPSSLLPNLCAVNKLELWPVWFEASVPAISAMLFWMGSRAVCKSLKIRSTSLHKSG